MDAPPFPPPALFAVIVAVLDRGQPLVHHEVHELPIAPDGVDAVFDTSGAGVLAGSIVLLP
jgi:hypothetical protein